jgi:hypothetical protein
LTSLRHRIGRRRRKCPKLRLGRVHKASGPANLTHHPPHPAFRFVAGWANFVVLNPAYHRQHSNAAIRLRPPTIWLGEASQRLAWGPGAASLEGLLHYEMDALSQDNWSSRVLTSTAPTPHTHHHHHHFASLRIISPLLHAFQRERAACLHPL